MNYHFVITRERENEGFLFSGHSMSSFLLKEGNKDFANKLLYQVDVNTAYIKNKNQNERTSAILPLLYVKTLNLSPRIIEKMVLNFIKQGAFYHSAMDLNLIMDDDITYRDSDSFIFAKPKERLTMADIALMCNQLDLLDYLVEQGVECKTKYAHLEFKKSILLLDNYYKNSYHFKMNKEEKNALRIYNILRKTDIKVNFPEISTINKVMKFDLSSKINNYGIAKKTLNLHGDINIIKNMFECLELSKEDVIRLFHDKVKEAEHNTKHSTKIWEKIRVIFTEYLVKYNLEDELAILNPKNNKKIKL